MDFSSLILMERDSDTGFVTKEVGSFQVSEGAIYVKKFYIKGEKIYLTFDTNKDVEEWEYSAVYDMFNYGVFEEEGFEIEDVEDEYNPTFLVEFKYVDDYDYIRERLEHCIDIIVESMEKVFGDIEGKKEEYI